MKENRIQSIVEANATDYFPIDVSKYVLSYSVVDVESQKSEDGKEETKQYHLMVYAAPKAISAAYSEFAENAGLTMTGITYTGDSIYHSVKDAYAKGTHILVKVEYTGTSITVIRDGELTLQRNINYGVDSAAETVRAFPEFGDRLDAMRLWMCFAAEMYQILSLIWSLLMKKSLMRTESWKLPELR